VRYIQEDMILSPLRKGIHPTYRVSAIDLDLLNGSRVPGTA
jgi:hypothetical protein